MRLTALAAIALSLTLAQPAQAGGTLTPRGSPDLPIKILDHHVEVVINNGFARVEVTQSFFNPNARDLEALYAFPVPESASLSEMTIFAGESELNGEVVRKEQARRIYEEHRDRGEDAGLASKNSYLTYEFMIARVPAQDETRFRFVYYQPLVIDTGIGRFLYPLESGGTDELASSFWDEEVEVQRSFSFHLSLESAWPVEDLRMPGFEAAASITQLDEGRWELSVDAPGGVTLDRDLLVYYRLQDGLPGRVELVPFRDSEDGPGTFMLVLTPGVDLAPLSSGSDYVFVLDTSGSMSGKLQTLVAGVVRALGELNDLDRFKIITFSGRAHKLTGDWRPADQSNVSLAIKRLEGLSANSGTNLYKPLKMALSGLDADRATSIILVTDAVANAGELMPARFADLFKSKDVRVFGFLMGNGANWPLMRTIADASGGFYTSVSNADDIQGQILLARNKVTHEAMHDAQLSFKGVRVHDVTQIRSKIYRGQQLVLFGRYDEPGPLEVQLKARITGVDRFYETRAELPAIDTDNPELERLWALDTIHQIEARVDIGKLKAREGKDAIADLGVAYQLVTDETSMLVLEDAAFAAEGIARDNRERSSREHAASARRAQASGAPRSYRVDAQQPAFGHNAPSTRGSSSGSGALDPLSVALALLALGALLPRRRSGREAA